MRFVALIVLGVVVALTPNATATTYDFCYASGFILQGKSQVLVQSSTTTARLYDLKGQILQTFELEQRIKSIQHSPDDRFVAVTGNWGRVRVFKIADGTLLGERQTDTVSFSPDASHFCFASDTGIDVYRTDDGGLVRQSAVGGRVGALQLGGETALKLGYEFQELDLRSGRVTTHKGKGASLLVLTSDGRWALCRDEDEAENWRGKQFLRVRDTKTGGIVAEHGPLGFIGPIRGSPDGTARIMVTTPADSPDGEGEALYRYDPTGHTLKELWRAKRDRLTSVLTNDFDMEQGLGLTTEINLVSWVYRINTGETVLTILPIGEHRPEMLSTSGRGEGDESLWSLLWLALGITGIVVGFALTWWYRTRRAAA